MEIGMALPTMAAGYGRATTVDWCRRFDDSPFASVSAGERLAFPNPEMLTTLAAAAALTERVRVFANVAVLPWHRMGVLTKQLLTIEQLAPGRLVLGVGVGAREEDYAAAPASFERRHVRLDAAVAELRRLWSGEVPDRASRPLGPEPSSARAGGPELLSGGMGPKALARAARWADGVAGFSIAGVGDEMAATFRLADDAWAAAGRADRPRKVTGCFFALGDDAEARLRSAVTAYLTVFGRRFAESMAATLTAHTPSAVLDAVAAAEAAGADELVLVPMSTHLSCFDEAATLLA
jgi:alkanesulfonate monooxygenase SsuD/methylene tetrahydromethanopterin reductase-like flavin-dependent oxidoreductase (luciferase family)